MGLFGKKSAEIDKGSWLDDELDDLEQEVNPVNYDSVLEWLVGLSDKDYAKVCEVAAIYRKANQEAAAALGTANEPTTAINEPKDKLQTVDPIIIDKEPKFLMDDEPLKETKNNKIKVAAAGGAGKGVKLTIKKR